MGCGRTTGQHGRSVAAVPNRTPRSSIVPCIGTVPTWGASAGTGPRPSGPGAPWACRRRPTRTRACSRTLQVGPTCRLMSVSVPGVCLGGGPGDAACADPAPGPCRATSVSRAVFRRGGGGGASEPPDTDVLGHQRAESQPVSWPEPVGSEGTTIVQPFSSPSSLHSSVLIFPLFLSFCCLVRALLDPVLCAKWDGRRNKVCSMSQTSRGSGGHKPCP